jgi:transcriptional regulator with XRE-family HTH domain
MASSASNPVRYFGQQVRKARLAAGWTLAEFGQRTGYDPAHLGRIENGKRPATKLIAEMCDRAFPERAGWFGEFYEESRTWIATPPWFRDSVDREQRATTLRNWYVAVVDGLLQTEGYARVIQGVTPGVTDDEVSARVAARMKRQAILTRDSPPPAWLLLDEAALRRCVGSPAIMAAQTAQIAAIARLPNVTCSNRTDPDRSRYCASCWSSSCVSAPAAARSWAGGASRAADLAQPGRCRVARHTGPRRRMKLFRQGEAPWNRCGCG